MSSSSSDLDERGIFAIGDVHLVDASTVVASAGGSPTDVKLMLELGAQDFIPKGPELRGRVTRIVGMLAKAQ